MCMDSCAACLLGIACCCLHLVSGVGTDLNACNAHANADLLLHNYLCPKVLDSHPKAFSSYASPRSVKSCVCMWGLIWASADAASAPVPKQLCIASQHAVCHDISESLHIQP